MPARGAGGARHWLAELHRHLGAADHEIEALRARLAPDPTVAGHG
jgi:hypothetical protein